MDKYKMNLKGAVSWSFEFENQEWFAGFRELATHGIDKPVLNIFRMLGMMNGKRVMVRSNDELNAEDIITNGVKGKNDVNAIASKNGNTIFILAWNYDDDDIKDNVSPVTLTVSGINKNKVLVHHYRIDDRFSNSFAKWKVMGKPQQVSNQQYNELEKAGQLQSIIAPDWKKTDNGKLILRFDLPDQAVSLIQLTW
jgi:xylan 1,4-beta-xylosidase